MRWTWCIIVILTIGIVRPSSSRGDELVEGEVAKAMAQKALSMFDEINDLQIRFRSTMRPTGSNRPETGQKWEDGFYAYKRGGYELLRYDETQTGNESISYTYSLTPQIVRGWRDDSRTGSRAGAVQKASALNFRLPWAPGHFLPVGLYHNKIGIYLRSGLYVVRLQGGGTAQPQLITPVRPRETGGNPTSSTNTVDMYVLTLSRSQGMSPTKIELFRNSVQQVETKLDVYEAVPGIWIAKHGVSKQLTGKSIQSEFWLDPDGVRINMGLDEAFFNPEFPPGTRVVDHITKAQYTKGIAGGGADQLRTLSAGAQKIASGDSQQPVAVASGTWSAMDSIVAGTACSLLVVATALVFIARGRMARI